MDKFNTLLQRYIANTASEQEVDEFMELLKEKSHEQELEKYFDQRIKEVSEVFQEDERVEALRIILDKNKGKRIGSRSVAWMAAASLVVITLAGALLYTKYFAISDMTAPVETAITLPGKDHIHLPDGSSVTLKEGSTLSYIQKSFGVSTREVTLTGEGYFDVAHDPTHPFKVHTGKVVTTVLGTAFNINASTDQVTVTVTRGKVAVSDDSGTFGTIVPSEQIAVNTLTHSYVKATVDTQTVVQWKRDYFILERVTVAEAANLIRKKFNVKVIVENKTLNNCVINAWFLNNEGLEKVVKSVADVLEAKFTIADGNVTIKGGVGCE